MTKKKKLRYSELAPSVEAPKADVEAELVPPVRQRRNSSPVELAHALAAARAAESAAATLAEQAKTPAAPIVRPVIEPPPPTAELLVFHIGHERFGVELLGVDEVIDLPVIHHVPEMPPAMLGVITMRGSLTPVYSPHLALGIPLAQRAAVLIFRTGHSRVGILIDDVDDAISLDLRELRTAYASADGDNVVLGVVRHADLLIAIVDADALIAACQQAALQEIA